MDERESLRNKEIIKNIQKNLDILMVNLVWPTEAEFKGDREAETSAKLEQIKSQIEELRKLDPVGYMRVALDSIARMSPVMHKIAILTCLEVIKKVIEEDEQHV